jgi:hypothetical protein
LTCLHASVLSIPLFADILVISLFTPPTIYTVTFWVIYMVFRRPIFSPFGTELGEIWEPVMVCRKCAFIGLFSMAMQH